MWGTHKPTRNNFWALMWFYDCQLTFSLCFDPSFVFLLVMDTGCSTALLPPRVVQALNNNFDNMASQVQAQAQAQSQSRFNNAFVPEYGTIPIWICSHYTAHFHVHIQTYTDIYAKTRNFIHHELLISIAVIFVASTFFFFKTYISCKNLTGIILKVKALNCRSQFL